MISTAIKLFLFRQLAFPRYGFARWKSVLALTLTAFIYAVVPDASPDGAGDEAFPLWISVTLAIVTQWVSFFSVYIVLCWWLRRCDRWDGRGDYFNLLAASWFIADLLSAYLPVLGVRSDLLTLLFALYSFAITIRATLGAISGLTLGYVFTGVCLSVVVMSFVSTDVHEHLSALLMQSEDWPWLAEERSCPTCDENPWFLHTLPAVEI
ncbi:MAG: hypothetical protein Q4A16_02115 [Lautropia sp.]|nr:hypothetical protein [Lautropia sp.]